MTKHKYITQLDKIPELTATECHEYKYVVDKFVFRTNEYYNSLIDWDDPADPIRRIIIPSIEELHSWGRLDASDEANYTVAPGIEHKYEFTALILMNNVCGGYCRFCFRKRIFMNENDEIYRDVTEGLDYIREHKELTNILLTGGDPLILSTQRLENVIRQLREIDHVSIIRIGSKIPAFNPFRITEDPSLIEMLKKYSNPDKRIYLMTHFNHPREITNEAKQAMDMILKAGVIPCNQTPLLRGINDDHEVLAELMRKLSFMGVPPYYIFQCRPTLGNKMFSVPIEKGFEIFEKARMRCSGLAKRARFVMSHATGKIEIVGQTDERVYFRYHRAANLEEKARFMVFQRNPEAYWFDDYEEIIHDYAIENPYRCFGPE